MLPVRRLSRRSAILQGGGLAAAVTVLPRAGRAQQCVLNIFNWDTYVAPDTIPGFEAASKLRVRYDLFASNDELFVNLRAGNPGYDLIFPSNNYAARLAEAGLLEPLDHGRIPNAAADLLIAAKPRIRTFAPDTGQDLLIAGEVGLCLEYNGDILQVMAEDDDLANVVPEEGMGRWEDTMCIPVGAPNPEAAHAFIDYIYEPDVHAAIAEYIRYALPNRAAKELIPEERPR